MADRLDNADHEPRQAHGLLDRLTCQGPTKQELNGKPGGSNHLDAIRWLVVIPSYASWIAALMTILSANSICSMTIVDHGQIDNSLVTVVQLKFSA